MLPLLLALLSPAHAEPDLSEEVQAGSAQVMRHYNQAQFTQAHDAATKNMERARQLPRKHPARTQATMRLGDSLFGLNRFEEAEAVYNDVFEIVNIKKHDEWTLLLLIEVCHNLGSTRQQRGDLPDARSWHETAWQLLQQQQLFHPIRFVVADGLASTAQAQGDYATAFMLKEWVITSLVHEKGEDHPDVAGARYNLAVLKHRTGEGAAAESLARQALPVFEAEGDRAKQAAVLLTLGDIYVTRPDLAAAEKVLAAARTALTEVQDQDPRHAELLESELAFALTAGRYDGALVAAQRLVEIHTEQLGPDHRYVGEMKLGVAQVQLEMGAFDEAVALLKGQSEALTRRGLGENHPNTKRVRILQARAAIGLGDYARAVALLVPALEVLENDPGSAMHIADITSMVGHALQLNGDLKGSAAAHLVAIRKATATHGPESPITANAHNAYAATLMELGDFDVAVAHLQRSLATLEQVFGPDHPDLTGPLNNLAVAFQETGDLIRSQELLERTLSITALSYGDDHIAAAPLLYNLGLLHQSRGDDLGARRLMLRSVALREQAYGKNHPDLALTLEHLAGIDLQFDAATAEARARRAVAILLKANGNGHPDVTRSKRVLAGILTAVGKADEAEALVKKTLAEDNLPDNERFLLRTALADIEVSRGHHQATLPVHQQLLDDVPEKMFDHDSLRRNLAHTVAWLHLQVGDREESRRRLEALLAEDEARVIESVGTLSERERIALVASQRRSLWTYLHAHEWEGDPEQAYAALLRFKGLASRSLAVEQPASLARSAPEAYARWIQVKHEMSTAALSGESGQGHTLEALADEKEQLRRQLSAAAQVDQRAVEQITPRQLCTELAPDTALVDFVRRATREQARPWVYTAFILSPGCHTVSRVELGPSEPIEALINQHRGLLASRASTSRIDRVGKKLRKQLWDRLVPHLGDAESVLLVPDGAISTVALGALPESGGYLLDTYRFRNLDAAITARARPRTASTHAVVVGGVDYGTVADTGETRASCASDFPSLPATATEATAVAAQLGETTRLLTGADATEAALSEAVSSASTVHLATHGFFATGDCRSSLAPGADAALGMNPMLLTGVALAGSNDDPAAIWTAEEIASLPLENVDLVVLSACETGLGEIRDGEGVMGLQRAFSLSGARATVMSLWPVDDGATGRLMGWFYEALNNDPNRDEAEALRSAQQRLRDDNLETLGEARPETWAAFVVSGSPRATP